MKRGNGDDCSVVPADRIAWKENIGIDCICGGSRGCKSRVSYNIN